MPRAGSRHWTEERRAQPVRLAEEAGGQADPGRRTLLLLRGHGRVDVEVACRGDLLQIFHNGQAVFGNGSPGGAILHADDLGSPRVKADMFSPTIRCRDLHSPLGQKHTLPWAPIARARTIEAHPPVLLSVSARPSRARVESPQHRRDTPPELRRVRANEESGNSLPWFPAESDRSSMSPCREIPANVMAPECPTPGGSSRWVGGRRRGCGCRCGSAKSGPLPTPQLR